MSKKESSNQSSKESSDKLMRRYTLTGAGIGLYFGLFFRPAREPSINFVIMVGLAITVVTILIRLYKGERWTMSALLKDSAFNFVKYAFLLSILEGRHFFYDLGGQPIVTSFTTLMGMISGAWMAYQEIGENK